MYLFFEYLSYAGLLLIAVGSLWLLAILVRGHWRRATPAVVALLLGVAVFAFPIAYTRLAVDLGPHESIVDSERHLTLTGWDRASYDVLLAKQDTVVLQMANPDVTDQTLELIRDMSRLRELDLNGSQVTDRGLEVIAKRATLETLKLRGTAITDRGFREHLMNHPKLFQLDLRQTSIEPETIEQWKSANLQRRVLQ